MKHLKKFSFIFKLVVVWFIAMSCMWFPYMDEARVQLFDPLLGVPKNLWHFGYTINHLGGEPTIYSNSLNMMYPDENIQEWKKIIGNVITDEDIIFLVYESTLEEVEKLKDGNIYYYNLFADIIEESEMDEVIEYLIYAKKVESVLSPDDQYYWEYTVNTSEVEKHINIGKKIINTIDDTMIKQRYAYQLIVLYRYVEKYEEAIKLYNDFFKTIPQNEQSIIKYWAMSHVAYCYKAEGEELKSDLMFLDVFYYSDAKKLYSYQTYSSENIKKNLKKLSPEQYYAYLVTTNIQNPGRVLNVLEELAEKNPHHQTLKLLINREVNKIENWLFTEKYSEMTVMYDTNFNYEKDLIYAKDFIDFVKNLSTLDNTQSAYYELVLSYLYYCVNDISNSEKYLSMAKNKMKNIDEIEQYHRINILIETAKTSSLDNIYVQKIAKSFEVFSVLNEEQINDSKIFQSLIQSGFVHFHNKGQHHIAALYLAKATSLNGFWNTCWHFSDPMFYLDKYASIEEVEKFMNINEKFDKNPLENYLLKDYKYDKNRYLDLIGTMYLRQDNFETALSYFEQIPVNYWKESAYSYEIETSPFSNTNHPYYDCHTNKMYTNKAYFVTKMIEILDEYEKATGNEKGKLALKIGNAYFNMSYYGDAWIYVCFGKSANGGRLMSTSFNTTVNENYTKCTNALKYYDEAIKYLEDKDFKAEAYFFAAYAYKNANTHIFSENNTDSYYSGGFDYNYDEFTNIYTEDFKLNLPESFKSYKSSCDF